MSEATREAHIQQVYFQQLSAWRDNPYLNNEVYSLQVIGASAALKAAKNDWAYLRQLPDGMMICILEQAS
jgi:hypothetical protein